MKETVLIGQATPEQIVEWKAKHKAIFGIRVGEHLAYFREPEIADMNVAMSQTSPDTPLAYFEAMFRELKIGGSDDIVKSPKLLMGFVEQIKTKIEAQESELVNL